MNHFLQAAKEAIHRNGKVCNYVRVSASVYNIETASTTETTTSYAVEMYEKHIKTSQVNYPNLIGKQVSMFYLAADAIPFVPAIKDHIDFSGTRFTIDSFSEHMAHGQVIMYKIIAVKT